MANLLLGLIVMISSKSFLEFQNKGFFKSFISLTWMIVFIFSSNNCFSQNIPAVSEPIKSTEEKIFDRPKVQQQLLQITKRRLVIREELDELKKGNQTQEITDRIEDLRKELRDLSRNFEILASQLHEDELPKKDEVQMSWLDELQELTKPLLKAIHEISAKPRKIENLKVKIQNLKLQIATYREARKSLETFLSYDNGDSSLDKKVAESYQKQLTKLKTKYNPEFLQLKLDEAERSLSKIQDSQKSILELLKESVDDFFRERGRNLFISITTFFGLWWGLTKIFRTISRRSFFQKKLDPQLKKLIKTASHMIIIVLCALSSLLSLYLLDDWLLLSITILFLMAIFWTSRRLIPNFLKELRIIMNLGTVREGERMIWKGVPFKVQETGFFATIINESLEGGIIRLPVGELIGHHSRPIVEGEPWFPTEQGDYVILNDGSYGRVEKQTMEQVILYHFGSLKYYPSSDFISQKPRNLSKGYRLVVKFGLDYGVQSRICDEIPKMFKEGLNNYLQNYFEKEPQEITSIKVHFDEAGASSLNLIILVNVNGAYADDYYPLKWKISKTLVQICNENDLVIPFTQLTVSLSDDIKKLTSRQEFLSPNAASE